MGSPSENTGPSGPPTPCSLSQFTFPLLVSFLICEMGHKLCLLALLWASGEML